MEKQFRFIFSLEHLLCVPATGFETAGAEMGPDEVKKLLRLPDIKYLAEMMNYPGVLMKDENVMAKIRTAQEFGMPVDGHAPGLMGDDAIRYIKAGISTDHECFSYAEALHKVKHGMKIIIREGSAAKNFEVLFPLVDEYPDMVMFCSDDKHPDDLMEGHINQLVVRALNRGMDLYHVLQAACINPIRHYDLEVGQLREGDAADFIIVNDVKDFAHIATYISGEKVASMGRSHIETGPVSIENAFNRSPVNSHDFEIPAESKRVRVIHALDGELITKSFIADLEEVDGYLQASTEKDILKFAVINRYEDQPVAMAFIHGFGLKHGAIASSVGHDSHNILVVGTDDESLTAAANEVIRNKGGISVAQKGEVKSLPLPIAGIMSELKGEEVARLYSELDRYAKDQLSSYLHAPFMTLSFMALLVIPSLKLSDKGLFDGEAFEFVSLYAPAA